MRAIGYKIPSPVQDPESLQSFDMPRPVAQGRDILVEVRAVSVNPVDTKIRATARPADGEWRVLGWDASGIVVETGPDVQGFSAGDEVFYAGALDRPGTNAEYHLVDERLVGRKPRSLNWAEAAAIPLTAITAWEMLFDRLNVHQTLPGARKSLLIIGGAGGVGSIAIQLARTVAELTVIATASRPETRDWVQSLGADHVINHRESLSTQIAALPCAAPQFVFSTTQTDQHLTEIVELLAPQGHLGLIDDPKSLDASPLKRKSLSLHWEFMFTRSLFDTTDISAQGALLNEVSRLIDGGKLRTTLGTHLGPITPDNLRAAHALIESGKAKGKIVLEGFALRQDSAAP